MKKILTLVAVSSSMIMPLTYIVSCSKNNEVDKPTDSKYSVNILNSNSDFVIGKTYSLTAKLNPNLVDAKYNWTVSSPSNVKVENSNQQTISFSIKVAGNYTFKVEVKDKNNNSLGQKTISIVAKDNTIVPPNPNVDYEIIFNNQNDFQYGIPSLYARNIEIEWIKEMIIKNRNDIFKTTGALPSNFDWENNVSIVDKPFENSWEGYVEFNVKVIKANNKNGQISKKLRISGFKVLDTVIAVREEVKRLNNENISLAQKNITQSEFDLINSTNILDILSTSVDKDMFDYNVLDFVKDSKNHQVSFKLEINAVKDGLWRLSTNEIVIQANVASSINYDVVAIESNSQNMGWNADFTLSAKLSNQPLFESELKYKWTCDKTNISLDNVSGKNMTFFADSPDTYTFTVEVTDKAGRTSSKSTTLNLNTKIYDFDIFTGYMDLSDLLSSEDLNNVDEKWMLDWIEKNKSQIFYSQTGFPDAVEDIEMKDVSIQNFSKNTVGGTVSFDITLTNSNNSGAIRKEKLILGGFPRTLSDEKILENCINNLVIQCKIAETDRKNYFANNVINDNDFDKNFEINKFNLYEMGATEISVTSFVDNFDMSVVVISISIRVNNTNKTIEKRFDGFRIYEGTIDELPTTLQTPNGALSWKNKLQLIGSTSVGLETFKSLVETLKKNELALLKEYVYQARFVLYQSFNNDFSQVNYYTIKKPNGKYKIVAEGVAKFQTQPTLHKFAVRFADPAVVAQASIKRNDVISVIFDDIDLSKIVLAPIDMMHWSFTTGFGGVTTGGESNLLQRQYGVEFDTPYTFKIEQNGTSIYNSFNKYSKWFSFVIGKMRN